MAYSRDDFFQCLFSSKLKGLFKKMLKGKREGSGPMVIIGWLSCDVGIDLRSFFISLAAVLIMFICTPSISIYFGARGSETLARLQQPWF